MNKNKTIHTPGPWQYGENEYSGNLNKPPLLPNAFQRIYMPGNAMAFVTGEARDANARLIAAAPELLEALEALYNAAPAAKPANADLWNAMQLTRAAIKKARGY